MNVVGLGRLNGGYPAGAGRLRVQNARRVRPRLKRPG